MSRKGSKQDLNFPKDLPRFPDCVKDNKQFIIPIVFDVLEANYNTKPIKVGNDLIGGPGYFETLTGYSPVLSLKVSSSEKKYSTLKELEFTGFSFIQSGDKIRAYINAYHTIERKIESALIYHPQYDKYYKEREIQEKEKVSKIEKLDLEGKVLATFNGESNE